MRFFATLHQLSVTSFILTCYVLAIIVRLALLVSQVSARRGEGVLDP